MQKDVEIKNYYIIINMLLTLKRLYILLLSFVWSGLVFAEYKVYTTPVVPMSQPVSGHFYGELNGQLWTWGGYNYLVNKHTQLVEKNIQGYAMGASVEVPQGTVGVGGAYDGKTSLAEVFLSRRVTHRENSFSQWQYDRGSRQTLPRLPKPLHNNVAVFDNGYIYTLGGLSDSIPNFDIYRLEWPNGTAWEHIGTIPGKARVQSVAAVQDGKYGRSLYVFGGYSSADSSDSLFIHRNGICMNLATNEWHELNWDSRSIELLPTIGARSFNLGCATIAVIGGASDCASAATIIECDKNGSYIDSRDNPFLQQDVLLYNTYTDSWNHIQGNTDLARLYAGFSKIDGFWFLSGGEVNNGVCSEQVTCVEIVNDKRFAVIDHIVLAFFAVLFISLAFFVRKKGDKFEMPPFNNKWMNSISLYMATYGGVAVWFLPLSAFAFGANLLMPYVVSATVFLFVTQYVVRKSFKKNCNSIYSSNKFCASVSILSLLLRMLAWLLLPAYIIAQSTGLQWEYVVFMVGLIPFVSCFIGDRKTSHLFDALQFFIIAVIAIGCICLLGVKIDGLPSFEMSFNDVTSMPFAVICLCLLPILSVDRVVVRRVMDNMQNSENEIKKTIFGGYLLSLIGCVFFCLLGVLIHHYYKGNVSVFPIYIQYISMLLPSSAINEMPTGLAGLMIAALFSLSWCALCRQTSALVSYFVCENVRSRVQNDNKIKALVLFLTYLLLFCIAFIPSIEQFIKATSKFFTGQP